MNPTGPRFEKTSKIAFCYYSSNRINQGASVFRDVVARGARKEPKWIEVRDSERNRDSMAPGQDYHDLGNSYPDAPVPRVLGDIVIRRCELDDLTGISELMNWISEGDMVIVKMGEIIKNDLELNVAVNKIQRFVEDDIAGEVVRLGDRRLLLLPPNFTSGVSN